MARMTTPKPVADKLRDSLIQAKKSASLNSIAKAADVSEGQLRRFLSGSGINLDTAETLAQALGLKLDIR